MGINLVLKREPEKTKGFKTEAITVQGKGARCPVHLPLIPTSPSVNCYSHSQTGNKGPEKGEFLAQGEGTVTVLILQTRKLSLRQVDCLPKIIQAEISQI